MKKRREILSNASSICHRNKQHSLKTDKCMTAIPTYCVVNQSSQYKDAHYVGLQSYICQFSDCTVIKISLVSVLFFFSALGNPTSFFIVFTSLYTFLSSYTTKNDKYASLIFAKYRQIQLDIHTDPINALPHT